MPVSDPVASNRSQPGTGAREGGPSSASDKVAGQIRHQVAWLRDQGTAKVTQFADNGKNQIATKLTDVAEVIESIAGSADEQYGPSVGQYVHRAASAVSTAAEELRNRSVDDLVSGSRYLIQNNPGLAIGTAALLGFAAARIAKGGLDEEGDDGRRNAQNVDQSADAGAMA